ncbi:hypothetical protein SEVIR_8G188550v4 [Setaria viridis]|uniref:Uncharacterized protein n=1 Tax=Setaria viridis TaxID=4556 RepID=A0A4U6TKQ3_SETVI|nr:hypothetical protein SEVIR_8G188550v2 [Setaria viridis]
MSRSRNHGGPVRTGRRSAQQAKIPGGGSHGVLQPSSSAGQPKSRSWKLELHRSWAYAQI